MPLSVSCWYIISDTMYLLVTTLIKYPSISDIFSFSGKQHIMLPTSENALTEFQISHRRRLCNVTRSLHRQATSGTWQICFQLIVKVVLTFVTWDDFYQAAAEVMLFSHMVKRIPGT